MKTIVFVILGFVIGSAVNMGIIIGGPFVIPPPDGVDVTDMESLAASMHLFQLQHFICPFLAHALGTLVGACVATIGASSSIPAYVIGGWFLIGGIVNCLLLPSPLWFIVTDLALAYIPMSMLALRLVGGGQKKKSS